MSTLKQSPDECLILVKAVPHRSSSYSETVCCAGVGRDHKWRRLYSVPFRILQEPQKFARWDWLKYQYTSPRHDGRKESQKVVPETISVTSSLKQSERSRLAGIMTREGFQEAESRAETLTLLKPQEITLKWQKKSKFELIDETRKHADLANQFSFFDAPAKPLTPCPYEFSFRWKSDVGTDHSHTCDDWETSTAFFRRRARLHSEDEALQSLKNTYENEYLKKGMRFAFGTHSRRKSQWLLVGILRVDDQVQHELGL